MRTFSFLPALLLSAGLATAQVAPPTKIKVKVKPGRAAAAAPATPAPAAAAPAADWSKTYAATITPEALKADLSVLASDEYEGRETGKKGQKMAAEYISKAFAADGLAGPVKDSDNPYIQHFTMNRTTVDPASSLTIGGKKYVAGQDFYVLQLGELAAGPALLKPVFAGYGIETTGYADLTAAAPAKSADLVMLLGEPKNKAGQPLLAPAGTSGKPSRYAAPGLPGMFARNAELRKLAPRTTIFIAPDAVAFAQAPKDYARLLGRERLSFADATTAAPSGTTLLLLSPALGAALLGTNAAGLAKYATAVGAAGKPVASTFKPAPATAQVMQKKEPFVTENVLAYLEGSDKKDEVMVLSAHYDHLGIKDGVVYNGADDDGSGTVSVLAMARAFTQAKKEGHGPRRSILFLANTGEEEGLLGSQYYTDHPIFPLANTVTDLNIDMVGRVDSLHQGKGDYLYLVGSDKLSQELHQLSEATNAANNPIALDYKYNDPNDPERIYYRSDHYNFAKNNVPIIFYTSGLHPQYHQPTDDVALIDFPAMARRDHLIFHTAWAVANRDQRVALTAKGTPTFVPAAADLARYAGSYANPQAPIKIVVTVKDGNLQAEATGQPAFPLTPVSAGVFKFEQGGIEISFDSAKPQLTLKQGGGSFVFTKE